MWIEYRRARARDARLIAAVDPLRPDRFSVDAILGGKSLNLLTPPEPGEELLDDLRFQHRHGLCRARLGPCRAGLVYPTATKSRSFIPALLERGWGISDVGKWRI